MELILSIMRPTKYSWGRAHPLLETLSDLNWGLQKPQHAEVTHEIHKEHANSTNSGQRCNLKTQPKKYNVAITAP